MKKIRKKKTVYVDGADYPLTLAEAELRFATTFLINSLWNHLGNVTHAADDLGISRRTLHLRIVESRINVPKLKLEARELFEEEVYEPEDIRRYIRRGRK